MSDLPTSPASPISAPSLYPCGPGLRAGRPESPQLSPMPVTEAGPDLEQPGGLFEGSGLGPPVGNSVLLPSPSSPAPLCESR